MLIAVTWKGIYLMRSLKLFVGWALKKKFGSLFGNKNLEFLDSVPAQSSIDYLSGEEANSRDEQDCSKEVKWLWQIIILKLLEIWGFY